jgi:hypothetical protein
MTRGSSYGQLSYGKIHAGRDIVAVMAWGLLPASRRFELGRGSTCWSRNNQFFDASGIP